jgi:hypothetical protein
MWVHLMALPSCKQHHGLSLFLYSRYNPDGVLEKAPLDRLLLVMYRYQNTNCNCDRYVICCCCVV